MPSQAELRVQDLTYVDIQHDALVVIEDVEQGTVGGEDIWVSGYKNGSPSVHGKAKITPADGGGVELTSRDGVRVEQRTKTTFEVSIPQLGVERRTVRFPRQVVHPPYKKEDLKPALHINAIAINPNGTSLAVAGPDGYLVVLSPGADGRGEKVEMKGHVGDVLQVLWFPSGEVLLSSSSDLSIRIWRASDGLNPRTLNGHTRAVTSLSIIGVGKQIVSASLDDTIRLWDVGQGKEVRKVEMDKRKGVLGMVVIDDSPGLAALGVENEDRAICAASADGLEIFAWSSWERIRAVQWDVRANMVSMAYSTRLGIIATGHTNGVVTLRALDQLERLSLVRRNEASVYSVCFDGGDLLVGTASGLPARLELSRGEEGWSAKVREELAGWEAVGVECFAVGLDGHVWAAGGEGGVRRY